MQLDADEDGEPFFRPSTVPPSPSPQSIGQQHDNGRQAEHHSIREPTPESQIQQTVIVTAAPTVEADR